jgi:hypothetical protein
VYLGCAELDRTGRIDTFDMWEHRRYVVTGALLDYWAQQFGIAPIDVVVGRFARAICCVAGFAPIVLPRLEGGTLFPGVGGEKEQERLHVGTRNTAEAFAKLHGANLRWVEIEELAMRAPDAFLRRGDGGSTEVLAATIEQGGTVAIAIPSTTTSGAPTKGKATSVIKDNVYAMTRGGETRLRTSARLPTTDFAAALFRGATPTTVLDDAAAANLKKAAKRLTEGGVRLADLVEQPETVIAKFGGSAADAAAVSEIADRSENALDNLVVATVKALGTAFDRQSFGSAATQEKLTKAITKTVLPGVDKTVVVAAAMEAAKG